MEADQEIDPSADPALRRVYIAAGLREARRVEGVLSNSSIEYTVALEEYTTPTVFLYGIYTGASFYVASEQAPQAREVLRKVGLSAGIDDSEASDSAQEERKPR